MNHDLLRRALAVCPVKMKVPVASYWTLHVGSMLCNQAFSWGIESNTKGTISCHDHEAYNAMTAAWLGWLGKRTDDDGAPLGVSIFCTHNCEAWVVDDMAANTIGQALTILEALAEAVCAVGESNRDRLREAARENTIRLTGKEVI